MTATPRRASWREVREELHEAIRAGRYGPGDRLPRDADLAEEMGCARATIQRAMQDLADSGILDRRRRGGTRVRNDPVTRATFEIPITRHEVEGAGARYGYRLLSRQEAVPPPDILAVLGLTEPQVMLRVEALHLADGAPYLLEDRWISLATSPEIRDVDLSRDSANEWLVLNKPYTRCELRFRAVAADADMARKLGSRPGAAHLVNERATWMGEAPITAVRAVAAEGHVLRTRG